MATFSYGQIKRGTKCPPYLLGRYINRIYIGLYTYCVRWGTIDSLALTTAGANTVGIATATPRWALTIASSTGPQLGLTDSA